MTPDIATARHNAILDALTDAQLDQLLPHTKLVPLIRGQVLHEPDLPVNAVYFPITGLVSLVQDLNDGDLVEVATVAREGTTGLSVFLGASNPVDRAIVQIDGQALRITAPDFAHQLAVPDGPLPNILRHYTHSMLTQLARNAACNRVHRVRQRAARWLLTCTDRMQSPTFELTQESLARMLAVRRASVVEVAQALADDGCITYTRGSITILDADRLHANACDCYDIITRATQRALDHDG